MNILCRFLILVALTVPAPLASSALAQDAKAKPAKSAQDCADELLRNKEAIEAGGESPQDFFHRCWWDSVPGKPTPIKSPHATWNPGRSQSPKKATIETRKLPEKSVAPTPPAKPKALAESSADKTKPESRPTVPPAAKPVPAEPKFSKAGKTNAVEDKISKSAPRPPEKPGAVVTAPAAAPASVKPSSSGAVVVKPAARPSSVAGRVRPRAEPRPREDVVEIPPVPRPHRSSRAARGTSLDSVGLERGPPPRFVRPMAARQPPAPDRAYRENARGPSSQGPSLCIYAAPDAYGRSPCVPVQ